MEMLDECDGVAVGGFRVAIPGAPVPDAQAVHLAGGVAAAYTLDMVAKANQQVRQVRVLGGGDLLRRVVSDTGYSRRQLGRRVDGLDAAVRPGGAAHAVDGADGMAVGDIRLSGWARQRGLVSFAITPGHRNAGCQFVLCTSA